MVKQSETSREAMESMEVAGGVNSLQATVYAFLVNRSSTDEEVQDALGMNPSTERPRRVELVEKKLVRDSGDRRLTKAGRRAVVWETTDKPDRQQKLPFLERLRALTGGSK